MLHPLCMIQNNWSASLGLGTMNPHLKTIYRDGRAYSAKGKVFPIFPTGTRPEDAAWLTAAVHSSGAHATLEIGMALGLSSVAIIDGLSEPSSRHQAIDPYQTSTFDAVGLHTLDQAGLTDRFILHEEPSSTILPRLVDEGAIFDFVFHDGSHLFDELLTDLVFIDKLLPVGGLLVVDDVWMPAVRRAVSFVLKNWDYKAEETGISTPLLSRICKPAVRLFRDPGLFRAWPIVTNAGKLMVLRKIGGSQREWDDFHSF